MAARRSQVRRVWDAIQQAGEGKGINLLVFIVALASSVLFPVLPTGDLAMPLIARTALPPFLGSILLAAITAAMMSTVDSLLIVAGSALSHDIYGSLFDSHASPRRRNLVNRAGVALVGSAPLVLLLSGIGEGELIQFIVLLFTALMGASYEAPRFGRKRATDLMITGPSMREPGASVGRPGSARPAGGGNVMMPRGPGSAATTTTATNMFAPSVASRPY